MTADEIRTRCAHIRGLIAGDDKGKTLTTPSEVTSYQLLAAFELAAQVAELNNTMHALVSAVQELAVNLDD